jgi:AcrR family transcriptional regulator
MAPATASSGTQRPSCRERLVEAARELFCSEGYGVSVDAISERAGAAKPTLYAHFRSKEALIGAALESVGEDWFATLDAELAKRAGDTRAQLLAPFDLLVADLPDPAYHGCMFINCAATFPSAEHPGQRAMAAHDERMVALFERLAGRAGAPRPAELARQLLLLYDGIKARGLVDQSGAAARDARAAAVALLEQQQLTPQA